MSSGTPDARTVMAPNIIMLDAHLRYQSTVFFGVTASNIWSWASAISVNSLDVRF